MLFQLFMKFMFSILCDKIKYSKQTKASKFLEGHEKFKNILCFLAIMNGIKNSNDKSRFRLKSIVSRSNAN